jgi:glucan phosphoethanolaminetransferase (alkaline phosphatase superfamily)
MTVFSEIEFWLLVVFSAVLPIAIYWALLVKKAISRYTVLAFGFALVVIAGVDVYLLQHLAAAARRTSSLADDAVFLSEISVALYLLPAMFGGIGINVISHVLVRHLSDAEDEYRDKHTTAHNTDVASRQNQGD